MIIRVKIVLNKKVGDGTRVSCTISFCISRINFLVVNCSK